MAQFLIYYGSHHYDQLTQTEIDARVTEEPNFREMYDSRYQRGDIIEVFPDGRERTGCGKHCVLIKVPGFSYETAKTYPKKKWRWLTDEEKDTEYQKYVASAPAYVNQSEKDTVLKDLREGKHEHNKDVDTMKVVYNRRKFKVSPILFSSITGGEIITVNIAQFNAALVEK